MSQKSPEMKKRQKNYDPRQAYPYGLPTMYAGDEDFLATAHYLVKALSDISYPITKEEIISRVGEEKVKVDHDEKKTVEEILNEVDKEKFEAAVELHCAVLAAEAI